MFSSCQSCWRCTKTKEFQILSLLLLLIAGGAMCFQIQHKELPHPPCSHVAVSSLSKFTLFSSNNNGDKEPEFEPLDMMLERARKRNLNPAIKVQAFFDTPTLMVAPLYWLTRGDTAFAILAQLIDWRERFCSWATPGQMDSFVGPFAKRDESTSSADSVISRATSNSI